MPICCCRWTAQCRARARKAMNIRLMKICAAILAGKTARKIGLWKQSCKKHTNLVLYWSACNGDDQKEVRDSAGPDDGTAVSALAELAADDTGMRQGHSYLLKTSGQKRSAYRIDPLCCCADQSSYPAHFKKRVGDAAQCRSTVGFEDLAVMEWVTLLDKGWWCRGSFTPVQPLILLKTGSR